MTEVEPRVSLGGRYSIAKTCKVLGICRNTLRKYTNLGAIRYGIRRSTSQKFYSGSEIMRFWKSQI